MTPISRWLLGILFLGILLRAIAAALSWGPYHPDEHQQYLEQGYRQAFGYGVEFWEQERGMRGPIFHTAIAAVLKACDLVGIESPMARAAGIRFLLGCGSMVGAWMLARQWTVTGHTIAGTGFLFLFAFLPDSIYITVRTLSESVAIIPMLFGWSLLRTRPTLAGVLFGLMMALRIQTTMLAAGFVAIALLEDYRAKLPTGNWRSIPTIRLVLGIVLGVGLFAGVVDWIAAGTPFATHWSNVRAQVIQSKADDFGIAPWYAYFPGLLLAVFRLLLLAPILVVFGVIRKPALMIPFVLFVGAHCAIGHKEDRFLWPAWPIIFALIAFGVEWAVGKIQAYPWTIFGRGVLIVFFSLGCVKQFQALEWREPHFAGIAEALAAAGRQPDVTGVAVAMPPTYAGNYFYLGKPIPLIHSPVKPDESIRGEDPLPELKPDINYVVATAFQIDTLKHRQPKLMASFHAGWGLYRLEPLP